jgi:hypothetical protein
VRYALLRHRTAERRRNSNATRVRVRVRAMCAYADHSMRACVHLPLSLSISLALGRFLFVTHARTHALRFLDAAQPQLRFLSVTRLAPQNHVLRIRT